jgi:regulator of replication initiation timing
MEAASRGTLMEEASRETLEQTIEDMLALVIMKNHKIEGLYNEVFNLTEELEALIEDNDELENENEELYNELNNS